MTNSSKVLSGLWWKMLERIGAQGIGFIISLLLARMLTPSDYGKISLITVFIAIANVFVVSGFGTSLIQKKDADNLDFSSVFYFNVFFSLIFYILIYFCAPIIANFYNDISLIQIIRVLAVSIIISGLNNVQRAYVSKTMQFKKFFYSTLIGTIISGIVGVFCAYEGYGVWAIVAQQLSNQIIDTIVLWFTVGWKPEKKFSITRLKGLFSFGWKLLVSGLLDTLYNNIYSLVIGKFYDSETLGLYNRGYQFPNIIMSNINGPIQSVLLPAMSEVQDNKERVKEMTRRSIVTSTFIIFPMMVGMAAVAEPMVRLLLTDKWIACVPYLQISCITLALWPIHTANLQAINAIGRSDIFLKLEIIKKIVGIVLLIIGIPFGVFTMVVLKMVSGFISSFINAFPNKKLLNYSYLEQIQDIFPSIIISLIMGSVVIALGTLKINVIILLIIQMITGGIIYVLLAKLFKLECLEYLLRMINQRRKKL